MRQTISILFAWMILCLPSLAIAEEDRPQPDQPLLEQQMQRLRHAQMELNEQRHDLEIEWQELEREREEMERHSDRYPRELMQMKHFPKPLCRLLILVCVVVHILVAFWVYQDIRSRGTGSGIWIVVTLISGLLGVLVYAVVRIGDAKQS